MKKLLSLLALAVFSVLPLTAFSDGLQVADAKLGKGVQDARSPRRPTVSR
jgi:hypothetical protein